MQRLRQAIGPKWWTSAADAVACRTEGAFAVKNTLVSAPWISLLGSFSCGAEHPVELPPAGERLVAFLALQRHPVARHRVAGVLWPDVAEARALASLRSTIWKLRRCAIGMVEVRDDRLRIATCVTVDTDEFSDRSLRLIDDAPIDLRSIRPAAFGTKLCPTGTTTGSSSTRAAAPARAPRPRGSQPPLPAGRAVRQGDRGRRRRRLVGAAPRERPRVPHRRPPRGGQPVGGAGPVPDVRRAARERARRRPQRPADRSAGRARPSGAALAATASCRGPPVVTTPCRPTRTCHSLAHGTH